MYKKNYISLKNPEQKWQLNFHEIYSHTSQDLFESLKKRPIRPLKKISNFVTNHMKQSTEDDDYYDKSLVGDVLLEVKRMREAMELNFNSFIEWLEDKSDIALLDLLFLKEYMRIKGGEIDEDLMYLIDKLAEENSRIPHLTYEDLIFINPLDDDPRTFFSGKIGSVESDFYRGHNQIEQKFDYVVTMILSIMNQLERGSIDESKIKLTTQKISQSWHEAMKMLGKYHKIPQDEFKVFRKYFQGHEEIGYKRGASGAFSAAIPLLDLLLGQDILDQANMPYFHQHIDYYPRGAKDLLLQAKKNIKTKKTLGQYIKKYKNEYLESLYNLINKSILQFRKAHKDVVRKKTPEIYNGKLDPTGKFDKTGGGFLNDNIAAQEKSLKSKRPIKN